MHNHKNPMIQGHRNRFKENGEMTAGRTCSSPMQHKATKANCKCVMQRMSSLCFSRQADFYMTNQVHCNGEHITLHNIQLPNVTRHTLHSGEPRQSSLNICTLSQYQSPLSRNQSPPLSVFTKSHRDIPPPAPLSSEYSSSCEHACSVFCAAHCPLCAAHLRS